MPQRTRLIPDTPAPTRVAPAPVLAEVRIVERRKKASPSFAKGYIIPIGGIHQTPPEDVDRGLQSRDTHIVAVTSGIAWIAKGARIRAGATAHGPRSKHETKAVAATSINTAAVGAPLQDERIGSSGDANIARIHLATARISRGAWVATWCATGCFRRSDPASEGSSALASVPSALAALEEDDTVVILHHVRCKATANCDWPSPNSEFWNTTIHRMLGLIARIPTQAGIGARFARLPSCGRDKASSALAGKTATFVLRV